MDIKEMIKYQLINSKNGIRQFIFLNIADEITKQIGPFCNFIKGRFKRQVKIPVVSTPKLDDSSVMLNTKSFLNTMEFNRDYTKNENQETNGMIDAILNFISKLENVPELQLIDNGRTLINFLNKPLQITKDIYIKVEVVNKNVENAKIENVKFVLLSNDLSASEIARWVRYTYGIYKEEIKNAFGDHIYFFDQKQRGDQIDPRGHLGFSDNDVNTARMMKLQSAPKQLGFIKNKFYSNKSFKNIFGKQVREIEDRVKFFLENKKWYDDKGIPYQLGLLLSGVPGSGKTSIIRAIANLTKRHIINVNFANIQTATQLKNLFFNEEITFYSDNTLTQTQTLCLPLDQRIYVLEEIDSVGDIVHQRIEGLLQKSVLPDELTLGEILTVLDGTLECPGRIVIMTSNYPDVLDKALIRPGRMDVSVKFGNADRDLIVEMFNTFFDKVFPTDKVHEIPDNCLTAAEVGQVFFRHFKRVNVENIILDLIKTADKKPVTAIVKGPEISSQTF
jgi:DNA replication protein DnaC